MPSGDSGIIATDNGNQMIVWNSTNGLFTIGDTLTGSNGATAIITAATNTFVGNGIPSVAGLTSKANLEAKGWLVIVNS